MCTFFFTITRHVQVLVSKEWEEQGQALQPGDQDDWDGAGVYTPNILPYKGKYYLAYTAMRAPVVRS